MRVNFVAAFVAGATLVALSTTGVSAHSMHRDVAAGGPSTPSLTQFTQETADPPVITPATPSCVDHVVVHHQFQSSYYRPAIGTLTPPASCPSPWSAVVLSFSASVGGVQFDRLADVYVGASDVFSTSTSEPCCTPGATVSWTWQKDVSEYAALFAQPQTVTVFLNNVNDATYTGVYDVSVDFTFYETGAGAPAAAHPDAVLPVSSVANSGGDGFFTLGKAGQQATQPVTFPHNLVQLSAELYAQGHGACEEFWWGEPAQCATGTPYREVTVAIDGVLAGAAPVYPVVFTGADGPGLWEPIPSPRAWNLRPYTVDLTPFAGRLVDGAPHMIAIGVIDASYPQGDYWLVGANLLAWVDSSAAQTSGGLDSSSTPAAPAETSTGDPSGNGLFDDFNAQHALAWSGHVTDAGRSLTTSVQESMTDTTTEAGISIDSSWEWKDSVTRAGTTTTSDSTYSIVNSTPGSFTFTDANTTTESGAAQRSSSFSETMHTAAAGLALNGAECEAYSATASNGQAYARTLVAAAGNIVADEPLAACGAAAPVATTPEAPASALLVLTPLLLAGVPLVRRRRRAPRDPQSQQHPARR